ncbi:MAG: hypothetical protein IKK81_07290 [Prevotella sp.]|nr:hypothetical protein [Prevotella sp.]
MNKNEGMVEVEFVVRKNPKAEAYMKTLKDGTQKIVRELTQEQMNSFVETMAVNMTKEQKEMRAEVLARLEKELKESKAELERQYTVLAETMIGSLQLVEQQLRNDSTPIGVSTAIGDIESLLLSVNKERLRLAKMETEVTAKEMDLTELKINGDDDEYEGYS